jgi:hypothetical protein
VIEELVAFHLAAAVVTLVQIFRVREPRMLPLLGLFACLAVAHARGEWDPWGRSLHYLAGACALGLVFLLGSGRRQG